MASHQALLMSKSRRISKLEATRIKQNTTSILNPIRNRHSKSEHNSRIPLHKFEQRLANHPEFESEPTEQPNPKSAYLNHGKLCSSDNEFCNQWCGNLRPEGNIQPTPFNFLQPVMPPTNQILKYDTTCKFLNLWTSGVRHPPAASLQSKILLSWPTNSWKSHRFNLLWSK